MDELKEMLAQLLEELHVAICRLDRICEDLSDISDFVKADMNELGEKLDLIRGAGDYDINAIYEKVSEQTDLLRGTNGDVYYDLDDVCRKLDEMSDCLSGQTDLLQKIKGDSFHSIDDVCEKLDEIAERSLF
ncbi:MAG: hypothetical protein J6T26_03375 [Firmicutes bacterium]|nr:hypothetical protein [Bacillota bacterium]